mgnify:CR=1 FL=1
MDTQIKASEDFNVSFSILLRRDLFVNFLFNVTGFLGSYIFNVFKKLGYCRILITILLYINMNCENLYGQGVNMTGLEKTWELYESPLKTKNYIKTFKALTVKNSQGIRLPIAINYFLNEANAQKKQHFITLLKTLIIHHKKETPLILAYFNSKLTQDNFEQEAKTIAKNWVELLKLIQPLLQENFPLLVEIVNEPTIYPKEWRTAASIIKHIQDYDASQDIIVGASNYNSMYELSRLDPLSFDHLIYSFHFYEPFIFTHQGTRWTGAQNSTLGLPFPFQKNKDSLPALARQALGTPGETNYYEYEHTGTHKAIQDKLNIISNWKQKHNVEVWCTEYGVTKNADISSRTNYINSVTKSLKNLDIPGYIWEWEGNFGVKSLRIFE